MQIAFSSEVEKALGERAPVVALESTVISHGLPYPQNLETAESLESIIREEGVTPATIALLDGVFTVGLSDDQLKRLATEKQVRKISRRDLAIASAKEYTCATTVATTSYIAHRAGIRVFSTGGIGGVHRGDVPDISADLPELARTPITVVCSGAKMVLDLPATREWLETHGVTVLGWRSGQMPAFYARNSGLEADERVESAAETAEIIRSRDSLELPNAILLCVPVPEESEIPREEVEALLAKCLASADAKGVSGKQITPFLLSELGRLSDGRTTEANVALLQSNARVAAAIAKAL